MRADAKVKTLNVSIPTSSAEDNWIKITSGKGRKGLEMFNPSWTIKKAEWQKIDAFKLWCWRRLLRVPWTARKSNHSILKEINPEYSLEGLMLKLKLQYSGHLMWRADSLERTLMLGKIEDRRRRGWQSEMVGWHHWLSGHGFKQTLGDSEEQGSLACCSSWGHCLGLS